MGSSVCTREFDGLRFLRTNTRTTIRIMIRMTTTGMTTDREIISARLLSEDSRISSAGGGGGGITKSGLYFTACQ